MWIIQRNFYALAAEKNQPFWCGMTAILGIEADALCAVAIGPNRNFFKIQSVKNLSLVLRTKKINFLTPITI
jgi:hypothetical protein